MPTLYTEIEINAPIRKVWLVLFHKEYWVKWNTFLFDRDPTQPFKLGEKVKLSLWRTYKEEETEFQPTITLLEPEVSLAWVSQFPGFRSRHTFELQKTGFRRTKYVHNQEIYGFLTRVFLPFIKDDEKKGMERMAYELKQYLEVGLKS
ncbi:MAG: SRPBCC domain-containing protein [Okeania sp. SIO2H7]|nr:SRPBCC domain-containing protein [Okeania sp. SIO2H7]